MRCRAVRSAHEPPIAAAMFREPKTLDDFDFAFNPSSRRSRSTTWPVVTSFASTVQSYGWGRGNGKSHCAALDTRPSSAATRPVPLDLRRCPDFLHDEAVSGEESRPGISSRSAHHRRLRMNNFPNARRVPVRDHHAAYESAHDDDFESPVGRLGKLIGESPRHGDPRPVPASRRVITITQKLPAERSKTTGQAKKQEKDKRLPQNRKITRNPGALPRPGFKRHGLRCPRRRKESPPAVRQVGGCASAHRRLGYSLPGWSAEPGSASPSRIIVQAANSKATQSAKGELPEHGKWVYGSKETGLV